MLLVQFLMRLDLRTSVIFKNPPQIGKLGEKRAWEVLQGAREVRDEEAGKDERDAQRQGLDKEAICRGTENHGRGRISSEKEGSWQTKTNRI